MTKREKYFAVAQQAHWPYPAVVGGLRDLIAQGRLSPETMIDYLDFWARVYRDLVKGKPAPEHPPVLVIDVNLCIQRLIDEKVFTADEWEKCRTHLIKRYMKIELAEKREQKRRELFPTEYDLDEELPVFIETFMKDGRLLSPNEADFEEWLAARFDEKAWCRRARVIYDAALSGRLEAIYRRIGRTKGRRPK